MFAMIAALTACDSSPTAGEASSSNQPQDSYPPITVYKSPTCGCCALWVDHMQANGFTLEVIEQANVIPIKQKLGVPHGMGSCHTAEVAGYVIEGHVPAAEVIRLLESKPKAKGLAVPGMPIGSPGMEQGAREDPYTVWLFFDDAPPEAFATYPKASAKSVQRPTV